MQKELRELISRHCLTLTVELEDISQCLARLDAPGASPGPIVAEAIGLSHKIKGSSGSLGFSSISAAASLLEHYLRGLNPEAKALTYEEQEGIRDHLSCLDRLIHSASPKDSALYNAQI